MGVCTVWLVFCNVSSRPVLCTPSCSEILQVGLLQFRTQFLGACHRVLSSSVTAFLQFRIEFASRLVIEFTVFLQFRIEFAPRLVIEFTVFLQLSPNFAPNCHRDFTVNTADNSNPALWGVCVAARHRISTC